MTKKLGERLVEAGIITEVELHRALTAQRVFGGHLGTSLLELGYLDEESLGEALSGIMGVPYADFDALSRIPYSVVRSLPARLVEKHKVVPLRLEGRTLHLAMIDPKNLMALDEISFVTGYRIVPMVAPEVRILQVLEKYYNLPRDQRQMDLTRELANLRSRRQKLQPLLSTEVALDGEMRPKRVGARAVATAGTTAVRPARPQGDTEPAHDHWEKYGYGRSWQEVAETIQEKPVDPNDDEEADTRPQRRATPKPPATARRAAPRASSLEAVAKELTAAGSVEEVVTAVLGYASARLQRVLFFVVRGSVAEGRGGMGWPLSTDVIRNLRIPLGRENDSLLSLVGGERDHYLGPVSGSPRAIGFYTRLGLSVPRTVVIVPIRVKQRIAAYLYADGGDAEILAIDLPSMMSLGVRAGFALQILVLRNKILSA